jgi:hypothetical protein
VGTEHLLHPRRDDGTDVDATFEVHVVPVFDLIYHHKAGGRESERAVNSDYHEGLELLLGRLAKLRCSILGIAVDSSVARALPPEERELDLTYPIKLGERTDVARLRRRITKAQKSVARRPDAKPGGGNDQKRIRITLSCDRPWQREQLTQQLVSAGTDTSVRAGAANPPSLPDSPRQRG